MGCGPSAPARKTLEDRAPAKTPHLEEVVTVTHVPVEADAKLVDTNATETTDNATSRETTPSAPPSEPTSRRTTGRTLEARKTNDSRKRVEQPVALAGPARDYTGLPLQKSDNERLTHITTLASTILKAPCAFVLLGTQDSMVLASAIGTDDEDDVWLPTFCAWALSQPSGNLTIENAEKDPRTTGRTWIEEDPSIRFYAGSSVHSTTGDRLGVLCVVGSEAKPGSTAMCMSLGNLAEMVARELPVVAEAPSAEALLLRAMDTYWDGSVLVNTQEDRWKIKYANEAFSNMTGIDRHNARGKSLWDLVELAGSAATLKPWERHATKTRKMLEYEIFPIVASNPEQPRSRHTGGSQEHVRRFKITMRPNTVQIMENYGCAPLEKDIEGWYFAVFTYLATNSRGSYTANLGDDGSLLPFEGVELGPIIGKGSFGSVYRAVWAGKIIALKVIELGEITRVDAAGDPLEASLMLKMKHPNIVETIQYTTQSKGEDSLESQPSLSEGLHGSNTASSQRAAGLVMWLMLEFCDLGTLSDGVNSGLFHTELAAGGLPQKLGVPQMLVILETALDIATGLDFIHSHSILHGDLTAGNVLLASIKDERGKRNFQAKIADFGLSRQTIASKVETNTYGTVTHMPPELLNEGILSKAADVYAFGVLLYEMFTRKTVWQGLRHPQIIHAIAVQKKHPLLPDTAPQNFRDLAYACMAAEPEQRPTFEGVITDLREMLST